MDNGNSSPGQRKFAMLRAWNYVLAAANIAMIVVLAVIVLRSNWLAPAPQPAGTNDLLLSILGRQQQNTSAGSPVEYKDFVSILLAALSVMIAVLGLLLAAAAIWGYQELKGAALRAALEQVEKLVPSIASRTAEDVARQHFEGGGFGPNSDYGYAAGREGGHDQHADQEPPPDRNH